MIDLFYIAWAISGLGLIIYMGERGEIPNDMMNLIILPIMMVLSPLIWFVYLINLIPNNKKESKENER